MESINVVDAKSRFSELLSRAAAGERFAIRRRERSLAVLVGSDEFERLERTALTARRMALALGQDQAVLDRIENNDLHPAMAAYGLWRSEADLAALVEEINSQRDASEPRPPVDL